MFFFHIYYLQKDFVIQGWMVSPLTAEVLVLGAAAHPSVMDNPTLGVTTLLNSLIT